MALESVQSVNPFLFEYVEQHILPCYDSFDAAHQRDHALMVINNSLELAKPYHLDTNMVYAIAAYHDLGLKENRKTHHLISGHMVRHDSNLFQWFTSNEIEIMAQAVEDHRASALHAPRSIYGKIVAEADRNLDVYVIIRRTLQYSFTHYPQLDMKGHTERTRQHLNEKYGPQGYLKLWLPNTPNQEKLHQLWQLMEHEETLEKVINHLYDELRKSQ